MEAQINSPHWSKSIALNGMVDVLLIQALITSLTFFGTLCKKKEKHYSLTNCIKTPSSLKVMKSTPKLDSLMIAINVDQVVNQCCVFLMQLFY